MSKKLTLEEVKLVIEKDNYKLLSKEYKGTHEKLEILCPKGHIYFISLNHFKTGRRCKKCSDNNQRLDYTFVKNYIEKENYQLLSTEYNKNSDKLKMICDKGHKIESSFANFQQGYRCNECSIIKRGNKRRHSYDYVKQYIEGFNYKLLSKKYKNTNSKIKIKCDKGHEYEVTFSHFKWGKRCPICNGGIKYTFDYIKNKIEKMGFKLLSTEYKNSKSDLLIRCKNNHIFTSNWNYLNSGFGCMDCWKEKLISKGEKEVLSFTKVLFNGIILSNDRTQILNPLTNNFLELDIYLPEINKAIEYNGEYWHSFPNRIRNDIIKQNKCFEKGIDLLVIKEYDWTNNKNDCKNIIKEFVRI